MKKVINNTDKKQGACLQAIALVTMHKVSKGCIALCKTSKIVNLLRPVTAGRPLFVSTSISDSLGSLHLTQPT